MRKRRKSTAATIVAARAVASHEAWRFRHPSMAKAERTLRKANAAKIERWKHKNEGTPETHEHASRTHQGALLQLFANGSLDVEQLEWAAEIANVHRSIESDVAVAIASLEARVDNQGRGQSPAEGVKRVRMHRAYTYWRDQLPAPKAMVLDMIVGDAIGFTVAARRYGVHNRKARRLLMEAIDRWPECVTRAYREIDARVVERLNAA